MIVASYARTGATKYCINLAKWLNLPFMGELASTYLKKVGGGKAGIKAAIHETGFQPVLHPIDFIEGIQGDKKNIWLVNKSAYLIAPKADLIVLRRDIHAAMMSCCKVVSRVPNTPPQVVIFYAMLMYEEAYGLITYCDGPRNHLHAPIVWFEDLYPDHRQDVTELGEYRDFYHGQIEQWIETSDIEEKIARLWRIKRVD